MYEERTGIPINNIVILIVTEDGGTQVFKKDKKQYLTPLKESIEEFYKSIENEKNN